MRPVVALALATDPISLFCDRLVDALLSDRTVKIQLDAKRSSASLKYLFTELVCNKRGGECLGIAPRDASPRAASPRVPLTIIVTPLRPPPFVWSRLAGPEVLTGNGLEEKRLLASSNVQGALSAAPLRRGRLRPHRQPVRSWGPHRLDKPPTLLYRLDSLACVHLPT